MLKNAFIRILTGRTVLMMSSYPFPQAVYSVWLLSCVWYLFLCCLWWCGFCRLRIYSLNLYFWYLFSKFPEDTIVAVDKTSLVTTSAMPQYCSKMRVDIQLSLPLDSDPIVLSQLNGDGEWCSSFHRLWQPDVALIYNNKAHAKYVQFGPSFSESSEAGRSTSGLLF